MRTKVVIPIEFQDKEFKVEIQGNVTFPPYQEQGDHRGNQPDVDIVTVWCEDKQDIELTEEQEQEAMVALATQATYERRR